MKRYSLVAILAVLLGNFAVAEEGERKSATVERESHGIGVLNKCITDGGKVIYTDKLCPEGSKIDQTNWRSKTNLTQRLELGEGNTSGSASHWDEITAEAERNLNTQQRSSSISEVEETELQ